MTADTKTKYVPTYEDAIEFRHRLLGARRSIHHQMRVEWDEISERVMTRSRFEKVAETSAAVAFATMDPVDNHVMYQKAAMRMLDYIGRSLSDAAPSPDYVAKATTDRMLREATQSELVYVSRATIRKALTSVGTTTTTTPSDDELHFDPGLFVLAESLDAGQGDSVHAILVSRLSDRTDGETTGTMWSITGLMDIDRAVREGTVTEAAAEAGRTYGSVVIAALGQFTSGAELPGRDTPDSDNEARNVTEKCLLVLRMMSEPGQSMSRTASGNRRTKKAAKKAGVSTDVNVLYRSHERGKVFAGTGEGGQPIRHVVRGHWRRQPYGPVEADPRPWRWCFIEEHERGTGELDERAKVYKA